MKTHPILFQAEMVRAILDAKKTQTRRIANINSDGLLPGMVTPNASFAPRKIESHIGYCKYKVGDMKGVTNWWF